VEGSEVTSLTLTNSHGTIALGRRDGAWIVEGGDDSTAALDPAKVDSFVSSVASLRFSDPAGRAQDDPARGFDAPAATLVLAWDRPEGGAGSARIVLGAESEADSGKRYVRREGDEYDAILAKWDADRLLNEKLADLLPQPGSGEAAAE